MAPQSTATTWLLSGSTDERPGSGAEARLLGATYGRPHPGGRCGRATAPASLVSPRRSPRTSLPVAAYGPWCASGHHDRCRGTSVATGRLEPCECCAALHAPEDRVAAAMQLYSRWDQMGETWEILAADWREISDRLDLAERAAYDANSPNRPQGADRPMQASA